MATVVFLGPSLDRAEAADLCPTADIRPPARKGDLLAAVLDDGATVIGLVDGEFDQSLSVWHKEVLFALESGVAVFGSSSMGALRAAELADWGMHGVGEVYRAYASGEVIDDDEVALTFADRDGGYLKASEPMINIRASIRRAVETGAVSAKLGDAAVRTAKALYYPERSYRRICHLLRESHRRDEVDGLARYLDEHATDVKADDARELLRLLAGDDLPAAPPPKVERTVAFDTMFRRERPIGPLGVDAVAERFLTQAKDAGETHTAALNRGFLLMMGRLFSITPTEAETESELADLRGRLGLRTEEDLRNWSARNRVSPIELAGLLRDEAVCSRLRRWLRCSLATEGESPLILDHLRLHDRLGPWLTADGGR